MNTTDFDTYLNATIGDTEGHLCAAVGSDPYRDETGKYKHNHWAEVTFAWPAESAKAAAFISNATERSDVYLCPYPMREPKRAKGTAVQRRIVHVDVDSTIDTDLVAELGGFIVRSGSAGHGHVYIPLAWPVTAAQHEVLCRAAAAKLGGDHKYSDNDLLRPPGTLNFKAKVDGGEPTPVVLENHTADRVDPRRLADQLGVDITNTDNAAAASRPTATAHTYEPVIVEKYPRVAAALAEVSGDRSADTYRVVAACRAAGLTLDECRFVVRSRHDLAERLDERRDDDLLAVWLKVEEKERTAVRLVSTRSFGDLAAAAADVNGADLLDEVRDALSRYVVFPSESAAIAVTLWIAATHALPAWQHATRLAIRSPQKRCGKSRLLDIIKALVFNPMPSTDMSTAVIYRSIGDDDGKTPTLLIDEADALFGTKMKAEQNEDLRGLLNAGFQRDRTVWRCVGPNQTPTEFATFAMCALAAIKSLPDTIVDRAVPIDLKRRGPGESVARFRIRRDTPPLIDLRNRLTVWAREPERLRLLGDTEPEMPDKVEDRQQDAWEPLVAIADAAGGMWPELARAACEDLCSGADDTDDDDMKLVADIRAIFDDCAADFIPSEQMLRELRNFDESPWKDTVLTAYGLSLRLKPFGVAPTHGPGKVSRGYWKRDFKDTFTRYSRPARPARPAQDSDQHEQD